VVTADNDAPATPRRFPLWMVRSAIAIAVVCFLWRHGGGQSPFGANATLNLLFDKWTIGPLRLLNLMALLLLVVHYAPLLRRLPRIHFLETLGAASLAVFVGHLIIALFALALLGAADPKRPLLIDMGLFLSTFGVLYLIARTTLQLDQKSAAARHRIRGWVAQGSRALISRRHRA
jgi:hypothetical protein